MPPRPGPEILEKKTDWMISFAVYFALIRRRNDILFNNIQRMENGLEDWITRKVEQKVDESLNGPLRDRIRALLRPMLHQALAETSSEPRGEQRLRSAQQTDPAHG